MNMQEALDKMKANPGMKMWKPRHYRDWEYNYYDDKSNNYFTETGEEWDIGLSKLTDGYEGYEDYKEGKRVK